MNMDKMFDLASDVLDPGHSKTSYPQRVAVAKKAMIATAHLDATKAAQEIMAQGGNAIDAAVAAAFTLGVVEPVASGLGGQTMMLISDKTNNKKIVLDGSSRAPNRIIPGQYKRQDLLKGHTATTVPSTPAVLAYALQRYGTKSLAEVLHPAIQLAENGFPITPLFHYLTKREIKRLRQGSAAQIFLYRGKLPYAIGTQFKQPQLAKTLKRLASAGIEDFYQGEIADAIHQDMFKNEGLIHKDDLAQIPWPVERRPISTHYNDWRVLTCGPPGAGRTLIEAINLLNEFPKAMRDINKPRGALLLTHVLRKANIDRVDRPADPSLFAQDLEVDEDIIHSGYAKKIAKRIKHRMSLTGDTTHLSVMDEQGNAVSLTQSIERVFGSFEASPELGFLYNNYMSAFEYDDIAHPYYLRPNSSPWASVAPTIIFKGQHPWLVIGSPGSQRIVSAILQVLMRLEHQTDPFLAVEAPRLHCSINGVVSMESTRMRDDIPHLLKQNGYTIDERDPYSFYLGCIQMVMRSSKGKLIGIADPRRDGSAGGL